MPSPENSAKKAQCSTPEPIPEKLWTTVEKFEDERKNPEPSAFEIQKAEEFQMDNLHPVIIAYDSFIDPQWKLYKLFANNKNEDIRNYTAAYILCFNDEDIKENHLSTFKKGMGEKRIQQFTNGRPNPELIKTIREMEENYIVYGRSC